MLTTKMFVTLLCLSTTIAVESTDGPLFYPQLYSAEFAEALTVGEEDAVVANALQQVEPFWADLVNAPSTDADGSGVYVAVLDTGLLPGFSPFFFSEANIAWNLGKGFSHDYTWDDSIGDLSRGPLREDRGFWTNLASGHGTHVTSTITGYNNFNSFWVNGVAPQATIIPVLVLDAWEVKAPDGTIFRKASGSEEMVEAGIKYVADLADSLDGPVVINMSLGGYVPSSIIEAAIDYAISKGVIVVAAAGNTGSAGLGYPGGLDQVISTGAVGWTEMFSNGWNCECAPTKLNKKDGIGNKRPIYLENFSSRPNRTNLDQKHQDLDVSAPGAWVRGPYKPDFSNAIGYYYVSGTSMASPHVVGIAACVLGKHPGMDQKTMQHVLSVAAAGNSMPTGTATVVFPFTSEGFYNATWTGGDYGAGFLTLDAALDVAAKKGKK